MGKKIEENKEVNSKANILICKSANDWLAEGKELSPIVPLYSPFWNEGETCFFFGMAGIGKTLFAVQMAIEISRSQPVLYCDFELSTRQFFKRYQQNGEPYVFPDNFFRLVLNPYEISEENKIMNEIEGIAVKNEIKVVVIDNLTWLLMDGQEAKKAAPFMKRITDLKRRLGLSLLIIGHTPKKYEPAPIELTDMAGSMVLQNFIDASFSIGKSTRDNDIRYLKQTKSRSAEIVYHEDNILLLKLQELDDGRIGLTPMENDREVYHINRDERAERNRNIISLHAEGLSQRQIAERLNISHTTVGRILRN